MVCPPRRRHRHQARAIRCLRRHGGPHWEGGGGAHRRWGHLLHPQRRVPSQRLTPSRVPRVAAWRPQRPVQAWHLLPHLELTPPDESVPTRPHPRPYRRARRRARHRPQTQLGSGSPHKPPPHHQDSHRPIDEHPADVVGRPPHAGSRQTRPPPCRARSGDRRVGGEEERTGRKTRCSTMATARRAETRTSSCR